MPRKKPPYEFSYQLSGNHPCSFTFSFRRDPEDPRSRLVAFQTDAPLPRWTQIDKLANTAAEIESTLRSRMELEPDQRAFVIRLLERLSAAAHRHFSEGFTPLWVIGLDRPKHRPNHAVGRDFLIAFDIAAQTYTGEILVKDAKQRTSDFYGYRFDLCEEAWKHWKADAKRLVTALAGYEGLGQEDMAIAVREYRFAISWTLRLESELKWVEQETQKLLKSVASDRTGEN